MRAIFFTVFGVFMAVSSAWGVSVDIYAVCRLDPNGDNFLALRDQPDVRSRMLLKLPAGTRIEEWGRVGNWMQVDVEAEGRPSGYVHASYTCLVEDH
ncbi:SH3 domain-containing protein [Pararhizobium haloflavum]|uniref:SH3 domain-containing protein n=1 Tax=Pararhizobium haloflavum TaxID=2037914 RepID=UPI000C180A16|nr:SH3 domain-containing protein [Pararhizobium haloflavum]